MNLHDLVPACARVIVPYRPGKPISELAREFGLAESLYCYTGFQRKSVGCESIGPTGYA